NSAAATLAREITLGDAFHEQPRHRHLLSTPHQKQAAHGVRSRRAALPRSQGDEGRLLPGVRRLAGPPGQADALPGPLGPPREPPLLPRRVQAPRTRPPRPHGPRLSGPSPDAPARRPP